MSKSRFIILLKFFQHQHDATSAMRFYFALLLVILGLACVQGQIQYGNYVNTTYANGISWSMCSANRKSLSHLIFTRISH